MLPICRFNRVFGLLAFAICLAAVAVARAQTEPTPWIVTAKMRVDDLSMIIVPVSINGSGPYDFLLDTGASKTMLDRKLADELGLTRVGEKTIIGELASTAMAVVHVNSLSVAGATVPGGDVFSTDHSASVSKVRGVLGEDFMKNFDVLIDYRQQVIRFEAPLGSMAQTATGEHLPLELNGMYHGRATYYRLVISGQIRELENKPMSLLLDSGANNLTLFQENPGSGVGQMQYIQAGSFDSWKTSSVRTRAIRSLELGSNSVTDLTAVVFPRRSEVDTDGLIPTSLFHSVFISSLGRFAILNPAFPR